MKKVVDYIKKNYYPRYAPTIQVSDDTLFTALELHKDKLVVITKRKIVIGVAVYLRLDDETFEAIRQFDLNRIDVLHRLLQQKGDNFHFILLTAVDFQTIRKGIRTVKKLKPKTISWWNPTMTQLHIYRRA